MEIQGMKITLMGDRWGMYRANASVRNLVTEMDGENAESEYAEKCFDATRSYELTFLWMRGGGPSKAATDQAIKEAVWKELESFATVIVERFVFVGKPTGIGVTRPQEYEDWLVRHKAWLEAEVARKKDEEERALLIEALNSPTDSDLDVQEVEKLVKQAKGDA